MIYVSHDIEKFGVNSITSNKLVSINYFVFIYYTLKHNRLPVSH